LSNAAKFLSEGDPYYSFELCKNILSQDPQNPTALNLAGVSAFQAGLLEESLNLLEVAVYFEPDNPEFQTNLGNVLSKLGSKDKAIAAYKKAMTSNSSYIESFFNYGLLAESLGRLDDAVTALRKTTKICPYHSPAWHALGNVYKTLERLEDAKTAYQKAIKITPNSAVARTNLASILHELGSFKKAKEECEAAIKIAPDLYEAKYNLGIALQELEEHEKAIECYEDVLLAKPNHAAAAMNIAYSHQQLGDLETAALKFTQATRIDPSFAQAHANLADLSLQQGKPENALTICNEFLLRFPGNTTLLAFKGITLCDSGKIKSANELFNFKTLLKKQYVEIPKKYSYLHDFNTALKKQILAHPTLTPSPQSHATRKGLHSGELLNKKNSAFTDFESIVWNAVKNYKEKINKYPKHPLSLKIFRKLRLSAWGVVMTRSSHQIPHIHPSAWISGVYYVKVPKFTEKSRTEPPGAIVFNKAPSHFHNKNEAKTFTVKPEEGLLILFPSYFYHHTVPFETNEKRISIAFDLIPL